jgi:Protein of unknown function (DUF1573)
MKSLFVCLFFSFLLTLPADIAAQEVKQNAATAAKMPTKTVASGSVAPKATPASASKPSPSVVKKTQKTSKKPASKGLFDDDYDGEVGIKYIGTEPASDEELARVKEVERNAKPVKPAKVAPKPAATPTTSVEKVKVSETKVEVKPAEKATKTEVKPVEKTKTTEAKSSEKAKPSEKVKPTQANVEVKTEVQPETKPITKPAVKPASKSAIRRAHIEFDVMTINLGTIKEDAIVERYFEFTNTGNSDLEILECRGSCGCIQPKAESTIVAAGERGRIYVKYIARNKVGPQKPVVTLTTNGTPTVIRLFIETWVDQIPGGVKDPAPVKTENN